MAGLTITLSGRGQHQQWMSLYKKFSFYFQKAMKVVVGDGRLLQRAPWSLNHYADKIREILPKKQAGSYFYIWFVFHASVPN